MTREAISIAGDAASPLAKRGSGEDADSGEQDHAAPDQIGGAAAELSAEAMHRSHHAALTMLHQLLARGQADGSFRTDVPGPLLVNAALALIHTTADATRHRLLGADLAGAMAEQLIGELWRGPG